MTSAWTAANTIAGKEISDARRTSLLLVMNAFMFVAGLVALIVAAIALHEEVLTYIDAKAQLIELGKSVASIPPPAFVPLKLLRGFIEYTEIIGAVLGIVLGYRAAAIERGRNTLALILTRPLTQTTFIAGKLYGNLALIAAVMTATFLLGAIGIMVIGGVTLAIDQLLRLLIVDVAAVVYIAMFFALGLLLSLSTKRLPHALLAAFAIWLGLVLIAPQIGDTLDPDNQVAGGVFRTLGIAKPNEKAILASFKTYEIIRDGIEQASPAKHFERGSFALTGIKEIYNGQPVGAVMADRWNDFAWLAGGLAVLLSLLFFRRLDFTRLTKD